MNRDGASVRIWHDTHAKAKLLAALRRRQFAEVLDELVDEALQAEYDRLEAEGDDEPPTPPTAD